MTLKRLTNSSLQHSSVFAALRSTRPPSEVLSTTPSSSRFGRGSQVASQFVSLVNQREVDTKLWMQATTTALSHIKALKSSDIVAISQSAARNRWRHALLLPALSEALACLCTLRRAPVRDLSRILEAFTKLEYIPPPSHFNPIIQEIKNRWAVCAWSPADLSSVFAFFARPEIQGFPEFEEMLEKSLERRIGSFGAQEISVVSNFEKIPCASLVENFQRAKNPPPGILAAFADALETRKEFAAANFSGMTPQARTVAASLVTAQDAVHLAEAAAKLGFDDFSLVSKLSIFVEKNASDFNYHQANRVLHSLLQLPKAHPTALPRLASALHFALGGRSLPLNTSLLMIRCLSQPLSVVPLNGAIFLDTLAESAMSRISKKRDKKFIVLERVPQLPAVPKIPQIPGRKKKVLIPAKPGNSERRAKLGRLKSQRRLELRKMKNAIGSDQMADLLAMDESPVLKPQPIKNYVCFRDKPSPLSRKIQNEKGIRAKRDSKLTATVRWRKNRNRHLAKYLALADQTEKFPVLAFQSSRAKQVVISAPILETLADLRGNFSLCQNLATKLCARAAAPGLSAQAAQEILKNEKIEKTAEMVAPLIAGILESQAADFQAAINLAELLRFAGKASVDKEKFRVLLLQSLQGMRGEEAVVRGAAAVAIMASGAGVADHPQVLVYAQRLFAALQTCDHSQLSADELGLALAAAEVLGFEGVARVAKESYLPADTVTRQAIYIRNRIAKCKDVVV